MWFYRRSAGWSSYLNTSSKREISSTPKQLHVLLWVLFTSLFDSPDVPAVVPVHVVVCLVLAWLRFSVKFWSLRNLILLATAHCVFEQSKTDVTNAIELFFPIRHRYGVDMPSWAGVQHTLGGHSFSTYAQISGFQAQPPTPYAQIIWRHYDNNTLEYAWRLTHLPPSVPTYWMNSPWSCWSRSKHQTKQAQAISSLAIPFTGLHVK